jgi:hypothetical protein
MVTESRSRIITLEQPTPLQLGDDAVDKDVEGTREMRRQDHKSICSLGNKPLFQNIRNFGRGATYCPMSSRCCCYIVKVSKRHVFTTRAI